MTLRTAPTHALGPDRLRAVRELLVAAFDGGFDAEDWDHALGGTHAWIEDGRGLAAHGSLVMRRVLHRGRSYRVGYVEAVAVRADLRRRGLGGRIMAELERAIDGAYAFGALSASDEGAALYLARGWRLWTGRIETLAPAGIVRLADEEDSTYLRPAGGRPLPDAADPLVFDWRDGDVM
ncbi:GNAT family N-acetyltransferase [Streptomyces showdoensis]|uniref:Aminoglycoside 2'-N-acetyltransferase n=1 Tax=Streptomyces showdoensis TaxID=68268 RepID=A0A2P2GW41_STREW|nr:GNAT family N-acetyltransferase [Streptomyces showdoensis]KKZ75712.1 aminoglycoside 2'-N-acetyltransferase [Streptomyces showdoensis]